ncbi:MAG TPA: DUF3857 domain-containing transglutaminase family protein [Cyclobacteriaceae bacterium]
MKCVLTTAVALVLVISSYSKETPRYPVSAIPEDLKANAKAVFRDDEMVFRILSKKSATLHVHYAITILNSNAKDYAVGTIFYDKSRKLKDLKVFVYDVDGSVIKKLKSSEIIDQAAFDGFSLYSDNRVKYFDLTQSSYPYTVEVEYDLEYNFLYAITGNELTTEENVAVQSFSYELVYPVELTPRFKAYNIDERPVKTAPSAGVESMKWHIENVKPFTREPMSPRNAYVKRIAAAPNDFEWDGYQGNMARWEDLGQWFSKLNAGRDKLPDETKAKVRSLVKNLKTNEEKAKVLYEYLQSKTRYVSIQLGIGGLQPFDAATVDKTGYGDCKALSNYMVAMLKEVNVPALYALILAGENPPRLDTTFPSNYGNHVIVAVPNEKDTLWLECTSQTRPFAYMGDFTDNRYALLITDKGGQLRKTPNYPTEKNVRSTSADINLDLNGNAKARVVTSYSGLQYESGNLSFVLNSSNEEQKKWLQKHTSIPTFDVAGFSMTNKKEKIPTATVKMDLVLNKYASVSNKRLFVTPNLMNRSTFIPEKVENRKTSFALNESYVMIDTIRYHIPESIYPEFLPPDAKYESRFGTYEAGFKLDEGSLIYVRKLVRKDGQFPPETYQELIDFYKNINRADNAKLVFLNKT